MFDDHGRQWPPPPPARLSGQPDQAALRAGRGDVDGGQSGFRTAERYGGGGHALTAVIRNCHQCVRRAGLHRLDGSGPVEAENCSLRSVP